jgi:hypothetical protein
VGRKFQCQARELVEGGRVDEENKKNMEMRTARIMKKTRQSLRTE